MKIEILAFGIAKDILHTNTLEMEVAEKITVGELKTKLCETFPDFVKLRSLAIAVHESYQQDDFVLSEQDEIVIIPPVSGG